MNTNEISELKELFQNPQQIVIVCHKNPDGDAMGSSLGLYHFLKKLNQHLNVIIPNEYPDFLKWLPGSDSVINFENDTTKASELIKNANLIFTLDFNSFNRTGNEMAEVLETSEAIKIMIDHHQQPDSYAKYMYSDVSMSSTCEMVYNFISNLNELDLLDQNIATCLYTGIMTDTGSFRFPSTTSKTHSVVSHLIEKGANNSEIHNAVLDNNNYSRIQLLGKALQNLTIIEAYRTAYIYLSQNDLDNFNFKKGDTEGFVNYGLSLKNIIFAVIFIENEKDNIIKMSFRSKGDFSVNTFARTHYNGGGHTNAAGGRSELNLTDTIEEFISILPNYKSDLLASDN